MPGQAPARAIGAGVNSLVASVVAATFGMMAAFFSAIDALREGATAFEVFLIRNRMSPIGIPGTALAVGILLAYINTPLYGTLFILIVGYNRIICPTGSDPSYRCS